MWRGNNSSIEAPRTGPFLKYDEYALFLLIVADEFDSLSNSTFPSG